MRLTTNRNRDDESNAKNESKCNRETRATESGRPVDEGPQEVKRGGDVLVGDGVNSRVHGVFDVRDLAGQAVAFEREREFNFAPVSGAGTTVDQALSHDPVDQAAGTGPAFADQQ